MPPAPVRLLILTNVKCIVSPMHKGHSAAEIYLRLVVTYGLNAMNRQNVAKWICEFKDGRTSVKFWRKYKAFSSPHSVSSLNLDHT